MDQFVDSCNAFETYPQNLVHHRTFEHNLKAYFDRLNDQERRLFHDESKASLDFWELNDEDDGASPNSISTYLGPRHLPLT